jgi:hypothetical protein
VRRPIAPRALLGDLGVFMRASSIVPFQRQECEKIMDIGLRQAILAAIGDRQGLSGVGAGLYEITPQALPLGPS